MTFFNYEILFLEIFKNWKLILRFELTVHYLSEINLVLSEMTAIICSLIEHKIHLSNDSNNECFRGIVSAIEMIFGFVWVSHSFLRLCADWTAIVRSIQLIAVFVAISDLDLSLDLIGQYSTVRAKTRFEQSIGICLNCWIDLLSKRMQSLLRPHIRPMPAFVECRTSVAIRPNV